MGRAIHMENLIERIDRRLRLVEDALEELVQTKVHHVDLHDDTSNVVAEGTELEPDEVYTAPVGKRKIKRTKNETVKKAESLT